MRGRILVRMERWDWYIAKMELMPDGSNRQCGCVYLEKSNKRQRLYSTEDGAIKAMKRLSEGLCVRVVVVDRENWLL